MMDEILDYVIDNYEQKDYNKAITAILTMNKSGQYVAVLGSKLAIDSTITWNELNRLLEVLSK